jgi:hypothetical protein
MDPVRFLDLAKVLKGGTASAEMCRTAIGRAYYAAFNVGVEALLAIGIQPSQSPSGHGELRNCLGACNDPELRRANARLSTLHSRRIRADYEMSDPVVETRAEADTACHEATEVINLFNKLRHDVSKDAVRDEMKRYARDVLKLPVR